MESVKSTYKEYPMPNELLYVIQPNQWNGFIDVTHPSNIFAVTLRDLGRRLRCFRIYKMGLKVHTFIGLKYLQEMLDE